VARSSYSSHVNLTKNEGDDNQRDLVRKLYHIARLARQCCRKTSGVNKDLQVLSEVNSVIPDKPGHTFKQITETWKSSGSGDLANFWATAVEQQDAVGDDMKVSEAMVLPTMPTATCRTLVGKAPPRSLPRKVVRSN
jgi:hypothetical protein